MWYSNVKQWSNGSLTSPESQLKAITECELTFFYPNSYNIMSQTYYCKMLGWFISAVPWRDPVVAFMFHPNVNRTCYSYMVYVIFFYWPIFFKCLTSQLPLHLQISPQSSVFIPDLRWSLLCLPYLLTLHYWFGIELFWQRMLSHSFVDEGVWEWLYVEEGFPVLRGVDFGLKRFFFFLCNALKQILGTMSVQDLTEPLIQVVQILIRQIKKT